MEPENPKKNSELKIIAWSGFYLLGGITLGVILIATHSCS
jgi:hypothetical protein